MKQLNLGIALAILLLVGGIASAFIPGAWRTAEHRAQAAFDRGEFDVAAASFSDAERRAAALYRAGDFETAAAILSAIGTPEAAYNRGNALVFLGRYDDAIASYDRALSTRPAWNEAVENRSLAEARRLDFTGGNQTGGMMEADDVVFDADPNAADAQQDVIEAGDDEPIGGAELTAIWLRSVTTEPGDFLRLKFASQLARTDRPIDPDAGADADAEVGR